LNGFDLNLDKLRRFSRVSKQMHQKIPLNFKSTSPNSKRNLAAVFNLHKNFPTAFIKFIATENSFNFTNFHRTLAISKQNPQSKFDQSFKHKNAIPQVCIASRKL
jgi:hypothetical protein